MAWRWLVYVGVVDTRHLEQRRPTVTLRCIFDGQPDGGDMEGKKEILALSVNRHITLQYFSTAPEGLSVDCDSQCDA